MLVAPVIRRVGLPLPQMASVGTPPGGDGRSRAVEVHVVRDLRGARRAAVEVRLHQRRAERVAEQVDLVGVRRVFSSVAMRGSRRGEHLRLRLGGEQRVVLVHRDQIGAVAVAGEAQRLRLELRARAREAVHEDHRAAGSGWMRRRRASGVRPPRHVGERERQRARQRPRQGREPAASALPSSHPRLGIVPPSCHNGTALPRGGYLRARSVTDKAERRDGRRAHRHHETDTRALIIRAAEKLFAARGIDGVSLPRDQPRSRAAQRDALQLPLR